MPWDGGAALGRLTMPLPRSSLLWSSTSGTSLASRARFNAILNLSCSSLPAMVRLAEVFGQSVGRHVGTRRLRMYHPACRCCHNVPMQAVNRSTPASLYSHGPTVRLKRGLVLTAVAEVKVVMDGDGARDGEGGPGR